MCVWGGLKRLPDTKEWCVRFDRFSKLPHSRALSCMLELVTELLALKVSYLPNRNGSFWNMVQKLYENPLFRIVEIGRTAFSLYMYVFVWMCVYLIVSSVCDGFSQEAIVPRRTRTHPLRRTQMRARAFLCCSIVAFLSHTQALSFSYSCSTPTHIRRPTHFHQHAESWSNPVFFCRYCKIKS